MGRSPCCAKEGLNRGAWTAVEDQTLTDYINTHGEGNWRNLPKRAGLKRCGKSCRLRWLNYLRPDIKRGNITSDEEDLIIRLHKLLGNRWSLIAGRLPGRTDNEIKNYWNTNISKKIHPYHHQHGLANGVSAASARRRSTKNRMLLPSSADDDDNRLLPESKAVRTKAVRCTRVFIDDPAAAAFQLPNHTAADDSPMQDPTEGAPARASAADFIVGRDITADMIECRVAAGIGDDLSTTALESRNPVLDLFGGGMDEFGYLDLYGLQGSGFSDIDNVEFGDCEDSLSNNSSSVSPSLEKALVFSDEMFEDWTRTDTALQASATAPGVDYWLPS